jgi:LysR family glycine cleavage system transcriptional activator
MSVKLPPLPALQAFEAAARHENFAAAAQELNLSPSAVSHRVRELERHLGYPLFERLPRGLRLTESAKAYLPPLRRAFEDILGSTSGVFGFRGSHTLTIRGPSSYMAMQFPPLVDRFKTLYPHIDIKMTSSIWADTLAMDETDIDLRYGFGRWEGFEAHLLVRDPVIAFCGPKTAKALAGVEPRIALTRWPLVHILGPEDYWAAYFRVLGIERERNPADLHADAIAIAAELVMASDRIAIAPRHLVNTQLKAGRLKQPFDVEAPIDQALYMLLPDTRDQRKPEATLFRDWMLEMYASA